MPFDDLLRPVAVPAVERHNAATCCGGRQEPDVGEGYRELGPDEILQQGDECDVGVNEPRWVPTCCAGSSAGDSRDRYRRRVTPDVPAAGPQDFLPNERWGNGREITLLRAEAELRAENERLRSEVELLNKIQKLSNSDGAETDTAVRETARKILSEMQVEGDSNFVPPIDEIVDLLVAEVERLRLRPEERDALSWCRECIPAMAHPSAAIARIHADVCGKMLARLGGGA